MSKAIPLNDGFYIPVIGLGTYKVSKLYDVENIVKFAIDAGYRHFDCAWIHENEEAVGKAIKAKIIENVIKREDLFITTKVWNNFHRREKVMEKLKLSLREMKLNYVDLYLIHWPIGFNETSKTVPLGDGQEAYSDVDYLETWKGMEDCLSCGFTRSIGLANFNSEQIDRILRHAKYKPVINQIEVHPKFSQKKLIQFCKERNIVVSAYYPFGVGEQTGTTRFPETTVLDDNIHKIGRKYNKSAAQVVLNYLVSLGLCVVPKSISNLRISEYIKIFDFQLEPEDVVYLDSCNRNNRICTMRAFMDHPHYPFRIEY
ncbi:hypothetical protein Zmor_009838 [Zophobas morio]|uniref:NADP-dependent oxidoreductase domain-containing protein n=1 Tax=Zophobas morio TaxID=2755281 RepID=A0AA38MIX2_9CUCU|nr:hypothetical protein Zmor_009838 [Zophobas morio]